MSTAVMRISEIEGDITADNCICTFRSVAMKQQNGSRFINSFFAA
jgi:hypothetical protein